MRVELLATRLSLVSLIYQLPLNNSSRSYAVHGFTISKTYLYSGHNSSCLTINRLDHILPNKKIKNDPWFISCPYHPRLFDLPIFFLTYGQSLRRISHIEYFYGHISSCPFIYLHSTTHHFRLQYLVISNNGKFSHFHAFFFLTMTFRYQFKFIHFYQVGSV